MAKNQTYRAFVARPTHVLDLTGEVLDEAPVLASLASEIRDVSAYATYVARERAEKAVKNMGAWNDTSSYRVVEYKMSERNM